MSITIPKDAFDSWPKCAVPACQNKSCRSLQSRYCWPHTPGTAEEARENLLETERNVARPPRTAAEWQVWVTFPMTKEQAAMFDAWFRQL